ncbi:MAG: O-antigen ligase domain-containing protein [Candidatus Omnitrophota bacterium]|nr:MAG: O-antigen ligase domain-containing protein [Candidatus Omnitrophota bacterium]
MSGVAQKKIIFYLEHPIVCWVISLFIVFVAFVILIHATAISKIIYPAIALAVGLVLYLRSPSLYIEFTWWLWFLNPFIRRVVDYQVGWDYLNPIAVTPLLVTMLTIFTLVRHSQTLFRRALFPFIMILVGILYCYFVGVIKNGFLRASYGFGNWGAPVLFAIHLVLNWQDYPYYRNAIQRVFVWGVIVMGLYGIAQFISPLGWDKYWVSNAPMGSIGLPEPFRVRIFSTLNSPGPFAVVMMAGLISLFSSKGLLRILAAIPGYVSFLLSLVRSAWGGWVVAILAIALKVSGRVRFRFLVLALVIGLGVLPLVSFGPIAERIDKRFQTFSYFQEDGSFNIRLGLYRKYLGYAFFNVSGAGLGHTGVSTKLGSESGEMSGISLESGVMIIPFTLGWIGTFFYLFGLALLISAVFSGKYFRSDLFVITTQAIILASLSQLIFDNILIKVSGMIFWSFLGLALSASKYSESNISTIQ